MTTTMINHPIMNQSITKLFNNHNRIKSESRIKENQHNKKIVNRIFNYNQMITHLTLALNQMIQINKFNQQ